MAIKAKKVKIEGRKRRQYRIRKRLVGSDQRPRICIFKSCKYTYAQIISDDQGKTLASVSTKEAEVASALKELEGGDKASLKSLTAAKAAGIVLAKRAKAAKLESVVFDRNGYLYHGRVKALAEGAREGGLLF
ncbi:MAG: 50S ribosomal protein L18 [Bdellovibrionales bacterium]|nr:50S ribosomal protein L18 [Bdellovibrionales bacterium]